MPFVGFGWILSTFRLGSAMAKACILPQFSCWLFFRFLGAHHSDIINHRHNEVWILFKVPRQHRQYSKMSSQFLWILVIIIISRPRSVVLRRIPWRWSPWPRRGAILILSQEVRFTANVIWHQYKQFFLYHYSNVISQIEKTVKNQVWNPADFSVLITLSPRNRITGDHANYLAALWCLPWKSAFQAARHARAPVLP